MKWKDRLINDLINTISRHSKDTDKVRQIQHNLVSLHLAIFQEPFLSLIFSGKKKIESRLSMTKVIPFNRVLINDIVIMKRAGGSITGFFTVEKVVSYANLSAEKIRTIEKDFGEDLCWAIDPLFLQAKSEAKYVTLIWIKDVTRISPLDTSKPDRTAWSIIKLGYQKTLFEHERAPYT